MHDSLYEAFKAKDKRLDGKYFMGVSSTGIYCRPLCSAKMPKKENCSFYKSAAEAQANGFRPCLICRPELAPGNAKIDNSNIIIKNAIKLIDSLIAEEITISDIAARLGISDRQLRRIFKQELNITPIKYIQTSRLLLAKNLLTDTNLSVVQIAYSSGFGSIRRFNDCFRNNYKISPMYFRKENTLKKANGNNIIIKLGYSKPYRYKDIMRFLKHRTIDGMEKVEGENYCRTVCVKKSDKNVSGYIVISDNEKMSSLNVKLSENLIRVLPQVLNIIKNAFDLHSDAHCVYEALNGANDIIPNSFKMGMRMVGSFDDFEMCVRAIIGQLISVEQAGKILSKFCRKYGEKIECKDDMLKDIKYIFPTANTISNIQNIYDELCPLGITKIKAYAIKSIADKIVFGDFDFKNCLDTGKK